MGLDNTPSWILVTETNNFLWPGPDLRPIPGTQSGRFAYGMLSPNFFAHLRRRILEAFRLRTLTQVTRSE